MERWGRTRGAAGALLVLFSLGACPLQAAAGVSAELVPVRRALAAAWQAHPSATAAQARLDAARARTAASGRPVFNPEVEVAVDNEGPDRLRTVALSQTLDFSGKRRSRRALGEAELKQAQVEYLVNRSEFARQWLNAWAQTQSTRRQVALGAQRITLTERLVALANRQVDVGDISGPERDLVLLSRDEAVAEQAVLLADASAAQEAFERVGGSDAVLASSPLMADPPPPPTLQASTRSPPDLQVAVAEASTAQRRVGVAEAERRPDPTLSVRGGRINTIEGPGNVFGIAVSIPLLVRNSYRAEAVAARADARAADADLERRRLELVAKSASAVRAYSAVRQAWLGWSRSGATNLASRSNALERLWAAGELSTTDYVLQLKQTLDTALAGAALEGRVWQNYFDYLYAAGELDGWLDTGSPP